MKAKLHQHNMRTRMPEAGIKGRNQFLFTALVTCIWHVSTHIYLSAIHIVETMNFVHMPVSTHMSFAY